MATHGKQSARPMVVRPSGVTVAGFGFCLFAATVMGAYFGRLHHGSAGLIGGGLASLMAALISIPLYAMLSGRRDRTFFLVLVASLMGIAGRNIVAIWTFVIVLCCTAVLDSIFMPPPPNETQR
jgi:hypothetical protein